MKKKFILQLLGLLIVTTLLFTGCSNSGKSANNFNKNNTPQTATSVADSGSPKAENNEKNITDSDLLKTADEDSTTQLDSIDDNSKQLSSDEIDSLLNDNSDINNIPTNYSVK